MENGAENGAFSNTLEQAKNDLKRAKAAKTKAEAAFMKAYVEVEEKEKVLRALEEKLSSSLKISNHESSLISQEKLRNYLSKLPSYNEKPFLASGVNQPKYQFGDIIFLTNSWSGDYFRGLKKKTYDRENAPSGIVVRETKQKVAFVSLKAFFEEKVRGVEIEYKNKDNVYKGWIRDGEV